MNRTDFVLRASFWLDRGIETLSVGAKLTLLELMSRADKDGVVEIHRSKMNPIDLVDLEASGEIAVWVAGDGEYAWIVRFSTDQPSKGRFAIGRNLDLPPPPKDKVVACLEIKRGWRPTEAQAKQACPRAWGSIKSTGVAASSSEVYTVYEEWRKRQIRPGACKLGPATQETIRGGLRNATVEQIVNLIRYAYEADEPGPRFWRGDNQSGRKYLGLDNLLVGKKIESRLQMVSEWLEKETKSTAMGDGTDLGPMAAYRSRRRSPSKPPTPTGNKASVEQQGATEGLVPAGTKTTPNPRPKRLNAQCRKILWLFRNNGGSGVRTAELAKIALKYSARISELRGYGYPIVCEKRSADGNNLYMMKERGKSEEMDR
jgi:hypothetical protein